MLTIPLKLINTSFEKYPSSTNKTGIIEEVKIKTIFGTKKIIRLKEELSDSEYEVYSLMISGLKYNEIAMVLDKNPKQVDNTIQRLKNKIKKILDER